MKFEIKVPTTTELAPNLKGRLLLVTGDMDNNVHPANTIRLVNALIKANKRFDFMIMPGQAHGYGAMQPYFTQLMFEYFAEHLLGDYYRGNAEIKGGG
jgi:dipeptidyl aminopeptidase/acylaminoacyl peptidase